MLGLGTRGKVLYGLCLQVLSTVCGFMWALTKEARDIRIYIDWKERRDHAPLTSDKAG